ncbi:MAG TPA: mevalonate kinase [Polyangiaceae bacterium]|nr:mevalonate kinase [Polyangiaceae bacterium]
MAFANGKLILLGEHAVVYGSPAIACGIQRGVFARADPAQVGELVIGERRISADPTSGNDLSRALQALLGELALGPHCITLRIELPTGAGLGASAAMGVACARAVLEAHGLPCESRRVLAAAGAWERVFHGNPSGIDAAAAERGGCLWFTKAEGIQPLALACDLPAVVAIAGPPASTREMVEQVARLAAAKPELVQRSMSSITALVRNGRTALEHGDFAALGQLMNLNQMLLAGLFVSTDGIERACGVARDAGAWGAKLTGSGGGGAIVAIAEDPERVVSALRSEGFESFVTQVQAVPSSGLDPMRVES